MLYIKNLTKHYGEKTAVNNLSIHIAPGEIYGFIGHNGAGKSTTIRATVGVLEFEEGEKPVMLKVMNSSFSNDHHVIFIFENGKGVRIPLSAYETKSNRRRLTNACSATSPLVAAFYESETREVLIVSDAGKGILIKSSLIPEKSTRTASGVILFQLKKKAKVCKAVFGDDVANYPDASKCKKIKIPAAGSPLLIPDIDEMQLGIDG